MSSSPRANLRKKMHDNLIFLLLDSVPMRLRGRLYLRICRRQMERWHPELRRRRTAPEPIEEDTDV